MGFKIGDILVLTDKKRKSLIKDGLEIPVLNKVVQVTSVVAEGKVLFIKFLANKDLPTPYASRFFRLATEKEILEQKMKNIFIKNN
mgnify:CR=1 FL=1